MKPLYTGAAFTLAVVGIGLAIALGTSGSAEAPPGAHPAMSEAPAMSGTAAMSETSAGSKSADGKVPSVATMVVGLEERLAKEPDDGKGWLLLAKSYDFLGRKEDARAAYKKADALGNGDAALAAKLFGVEPVQ